ncbi:MAG TPA: universal stress protein [Gaiellaceae bacterium]
MLVATDGSPPAELAVDVGIQFARGAGHSLVFVHTDPSIAGRLFTENPMAGDSDDRVASVDDILGEAVRRATEQGVQAEVELLGEHGVRHVAAAIVGVAMARGADAIVVGTHGRGAVAQAILGSVSHEISALAHVPVIVVHSPAGESDE